MGICFSTASFVASHTVEINSTPNAVAAKVVDPEAIMKADGVKPKCYHVIVPGKEFIVEGKDGVELMEVLERSPDGMHTVIRVTGAESGCTRKELLAKPLFEVYEKWEISPGRRTGTTTLKKTWYNFKQQGSWFVPLLPAIRTAAAKDTAHLAKAWSSF
eukprot:796246-Pleurochrysis_carterae.AAC.1